MPDLPGTMIELRVEFDDGDWLFTRFNGTTDEAEDYYFGRVFTSRDERPRRVTGLQFLSEGGRVERV